MKRILAIWALASALALGCGGNDGSGSDVKEAADAATEDQSSNDIPGQPDDDGTVLPPDDVDSPDGTVDPGDVDDDTGNPDPQLGPCSTLQPMESLADLEASYSSANWKATLLEVLNRRYDAGYDILTSVKDQAQLPNFVNPANWDNFIMSVSTAVHEMDHMYGFEGGGWSDYFYFVCSSVKVKVPRIQTSPRSVVYPLIPSNVMPWVKTWADLYLTGMMGSQDFLTLLDELNAYTHSLYCDYQLSDQFPFGMALSSWDGLGSFMLFVELYLKAVRTDSPQTYNTIKGNAVLKKAILDIFTRAEDGIYLTDGKKQQLSIHGEAILDAVFATENHQEIEFLAQ